MISGPACYAHIKSAFKKWIIPSDHQVTGSGSHFANGFVSEMIHPAPRIALSPFFTVPVAV
ncbi:hypothetical protein BCON_0085g00240 [Botryotinia convoluta]|uniref:Uncharacterized protein n=1 Tax=Botryotinia convoluta TaxID=54673 RepID=A0A4Z1IGM3_9HELO|nr:hypothetical protein BCON_0085g00240 [Botryotinia convoluta]